MKILTGILVITILLAESNAAPYRRDNYRNTRERRKVLNYHARQFLRRIRADDDSLFLKEGK